MKILEINVTSGSGSTGRIASDLASELVKIGHDVVVAYGRDFHDTGIKTYKIGNTISIYNHVIKARLFDKSGFGSYNSTVKFVDWIKKFNPDIIHLHNIHGYYLNIKVLFEYLKNEFNGKILWTLHDCWAFTGHCSYFDYSQCNQWKKECKKCSKQQKNRYPKTIISNCKNNLKIKKKLFTNLKNITLITPSLWLKKLVEQSFLKDYPVIVINNGIDTNVFKPTQSDLRNRYNLVDKKIILGVASVWDDRKGLNDIIKLSSLLDDNSKIVLIGLSEKQLKIIPNNIIGIQRTNSINELAAWYSTADVLFNPTYEDNYPTVNLEAQACGTPVITYNTGGSVESVPKNNVITQGDLSKLVNIKYDELEVNKQNFSKNMMFSKYIELFKYEGDRK